MQSALAPLSEDSIERHAEVLRLRDCVAESERQIQPLLDYITLLKRKRFGPSADRISPDQLRLFDEAEFEALIAELEIAAATPRQPAREQPKDKPVRRPLPRVERIIDLPKAQKQAMGSDWTSSATTSPSSWR